MDGAAGFGCRGKENAHKRAAAENLARPKYCLSYFFLNIGAAYTVQDSCSVRPLFFYFYFFLTLLYPAKPVLDQSGAREQTLWRTIKPPK
jgi:hypothetical protein